MDREGNGRRWRTWFSCLSASERLEVLTISNTRWVSTIMAMASEEESFRSSNPRAPIQSLKRCRFAFTDDDLQPPAPDEHSRGKKTTALKTDDKTLSMLREELLRAGGSSEAVEKLLKKLAGKKSDCDGGQTDQTEDACSFKGEARQFVTVRTDPEARERGTMGYIVLSDHLDRKRELSSLLLSRLNVIHKDGKPWALRPDCELVADLRTFWEMMQVMSNGEFLKGGEEAEVKRADKEAEVWKEAAWLCKSGKEISAVCPSECLTLCSFTCAELICSTFEERMRSASLNGGRKVEKDEGAMLSPIHRWWHEIPCDLKMFHLMKSLVRLRSKITENLSNTSTASPKELEPLLSLRTFFLDVSQLSESRRENGLRYGDDDCGWFSSLQQLSHHRSSRLSICHDSLCLISSSSPLLAPPPSRFYRFTRLILQELKHAFARHNESLIAEMQHREEQQEETVKQRKKEANRKKKEKEKERKARRRDAAAKEEEAALAREREMTLERENARRRDKRRAKWRVLAASVIQKRIDDELEMRRCIASVLHELVRKSVSLATSRRSLREKESRRRKKPSEWSFTESPFLAGRFSSVPGAFSRSSSSSSNAGASNFFLPFSFSEPEGFLRSQWGNAYLLPADVMEQEAQVKLPSSSRYSRSGFMSGKTNFNDPFFPQNCGHPMHCCNLHAGLFSNNPMGTMGTGSGVLGDFLDERQHGGGREVQCEQTLNSSAAKRNQMHHPNPDSKIGWKMQFNQNSQTLFGGRADLGQFVPPSRTYDEAEKVFSPPGSDGARRDTKILGQQFASNKSADSQMLDHLSQRMYWEEEMMDNGFPLLDLSAGPSMLSTPDQSPSFRNANISWASPSFSPAVPPFSRAGMVQPSGFPSSEPLVEGQQELNFLFDSQGVEQLCASSDSSIRTSVTPDSMQRMELLRPEGREQVSSPFTQQEVNLPGGSPGDSQEGGSKLQEEGNPNHGAVNCENPKVKTDSAKACSSSSSSSALLPPPLLRCFLAWQCWC
uniref:Uncharacterized protein n=1 Tax=Hanusia phi TaxID=3032 RepID=A0A7S0H8G5_9CRYP